MSHPGQTSRRSLPGEGGCWQLPCTFGSLLSPTGQQSRATSSTQQLVQETQSQGLSWPRGRGLLEMLNRGCLFFSPLRELQNPWPKLNSEESVTAGSGLGKCVPQPERREHREKENQKRANPEGKWSRSERRLKPRREGKGTAFQRALLFTTLEPTLKPIFVTCNEDGKQKGGNSPQITNVVYLVSKQLFSFRYKRSGSILEV